MRITYLLPTTAVPPFPFPIKLAQILFSQPSHSIHPDLRADHRWYRRDGTETTQVDDSRRIFQGITGNTALVRAASQWNGGPGVLANPEPV